MLRKMWLTVKRRWLPYAYAYTAKFTMRLLLRTCRIEVKGLDYLTETAESAPCIVMLWHNRLVVVAEILTSLTPGYAYAPLISKSRDGDPLAILAHSYPKGRALRVAHNARHCALSQLIHVLRKRQNIVIITPDGPRGPCYSVKPGIVAAARTAGAKIVPFNWTASRHWQLNTWDRMRIPKPFSKIQVAFGCPVALADQAHTLAEDAALLHSALIELEK